MRFSHTANCCSHNAVGFMKLVSYCYIEPAATTLCSQGYHQFS